MQSGPSSHCLRIRVEEAIQGGPQKVAKHIRRLEEWQQTIAKSYPWPALYRSVQEDIDRLKSALLV